LRAAVLSDVHSNRPALESVLGAVAEAEVDQVWCLGDVVGYGADPDACTALIRERCDVCLVGNHDLAVLGGLDISSFSETAAAAVEWTRENVAPETLDFLRGLEPAGARDGVGLFHASPRDPIWEYVLSVDQAEAGLDVQSERVCLIGHSHISLFFTRPDDAKGTQTHGAQAGDGALLDLAAGSWLINPGSVGQPRDGDARAAWLELDTGEWTARFHRSPYDTEAAAAAILAAGLPSPLAERLEVGR
jgi:diadenosine tetraphosphatase ApaH/serine/threonine PP2A family protein phosphatase